MWVCQRSSSRAPDRLEVAEGALNPHIKLVVALRQDGTGRVRQIKFRAQAALSPEILKAPCGPLGPAGCLSFGTSGKAHPTRLNGTVWFRNSMRSEHAAPVERSRRRRAINSPAWALAAMPRSYQQPGRAS